MTEFSDEIKKLEQDLKKAEEYRGKEGAEFKAFQETVEKLNKAQKESDYEHIERIVQHLIKEEGKMSDIEQKLETFTKKINEELPYLEQAVDNKEELKRWKKELFESLNRLKKELSENSELFLLLHSKDNWTGPEYEKLIVPIRNIKNQLSGLSNILGYLNLELQTKEKALKNYKSSDESVAGDLKIAGILSNYFNSVFFNSTNYIDKHQLYLVIRRFREHENLAGYLNSAHFINHQEIKIKINKKELNKILENIDTMIKNGEILQEDGLKVKSFIQENKFIPFSTKAFALALKIIIRSLYSYTDTHEVGGSLTFSGAEMDNFNKEEFDKFENKIKGLKYILQIKQHPFLMINFFENRFSFYKDDWQILSYKYPICNLGIRVFVNNSFGIIPTIIKLRTKMF